MKTRLLEDALLLVEQNFYFLHVGEFFAKLSRQMSFEEYDLGVSLKCDEIRSYSFHPQFTRAVLEDSRQSGEMIGLFDYFVIFNAFRGICMAMVESLRFESEFKYFLQECLGERYEDFFDILSFVRNVLSHNIHAEIALSQKDYDGTLKRIRRMNRKANIEFTFLYAIDLPQIIAPHQSYGFTCRVDFEELEEGMEFLEIIPLWELCMISELSFNFIQAFRESVANIQVQP